MISKIYENVIEQLRYDTSLKFREVKQKEINTYNKLFKWYNNIGCIHHALGNYSEAHKYFSNILREKRFKVAKKNNWASACLNWAVNLIKTIERQTKINRNPSKQIQKEIEEKVESAISRIKWVIQSQDKIGWNTEIEWAARLSLIYWLLVTKEYEEWEIEINVLKNVIKDIQRYQQDDKLASILTQYKIYYKTLLIMDVNLFKDHIWGWYLSNDILRASSRFLCGKWDNQSNRYGNTFSKSNFTKLSSIWNIPDKLFKHKITYFSALRNIYILLYGFKYVDPEIFKGTIQLVKNYFDSKSEKLFLKTYKPLQILSHHSSHFFNSSSKCNILLSYNPKLLSNFHNSHSCIQKILNCLAPNDTFSLFT